MRIAIAAISESDIVVSTGAVTDVMNEFIGASLAVLVGMLSVLGLREGEVTLSGGLELRHLVDAVLG